MSRSGARSSSGGAGVKCTPGEGVLLRGGLLLIGEVDALGERGIVRTIYDPTAGTGGVRSVAAGVVIHSHDEWITAEWQLPSEWTRPRRSLGHSFDWKR